MFDYLCIVLAVPGNWKNGLSPLFASVCLPADNRAQSGHTDNPNILNHQKTIRIMKKKNWLIMLCMAMALALPAVLTSCGDDEDGSTNGGGNNGGNGGNTSELTVSQQKERLESTALELMGKVNTNDFQSIADLFEQVTDNGDPGDVLSDWFETCADACKLTVLGNGTERYLYTASNFYGQFTYSNGRWKQTGKESGNLTFNFNNQNGTPCQLKVTATAKGATLHHNSFDSWESDYNGQWYNDEHFKENSFVVPDKVTVTLSQGGTKLATATVNTKLTLSNGPEVDLGKDKAYVTAELMVNDYKIVVEKAQYNMAGGSNNTATASAKLYKGSELLVTASASAAGTVREEDDPIVKSVSVSCDVLGKVQVRGTVNNVNQISDYLDDISEKYYNNEEATKNAIRKINELTDLGLYFDGRQDKSAEVKYQARYDDYGYNGYWSEEQVVVFPDGSAYQSFEEYFDEYTYDSVIRKFEDICEQFAKMFGCDDDNDRYSYAPSHRKSN